MRLTEEEVRYILGLIAKTLPGSFGYSDDLMVAALQAKLSMWLEVVSSRRTDLKPT